MAMANSLDYLPDVDCREPGFSKSENTKPQSEEMELELLVEELAEFIESEDGILIP